MQRSERGTQVTTVTSIYPVLFSYAPNTSQLPFCQFEFWWKIKTLRGGRCNHGQLKSLCDEGTVIFFLLVHTNSKCLHCTLVCLPLDTEPTTAHICSLWDLNKSKRNHSSYWSIWTIRTLPKQINMMTAFLSSSSIRITTTIITCWLV